MESYTVYSLPRRQQAISGIIPSVKNCLAAKFEISHQTDNNEFEAIDLYLWKNIKHIKSSSAWIEARVAIEARFQERLKLLETSSFSIC